MSRRSLFLAAALTLSACDASDPTDVSTADLDDAAVVIASAVALDAGGVLEDAAVSASLAATADDGARHAGPDRPGCDNTRTYDGTAGLWTAVIDCERGNPDGAFYASFERTSTYQFLDAAGAPTEERDGAVSVDYDVLSGSSLFRSPRGTHALRSLAVDLTVADLDADLVTVDGSVQRSTADTLRGLRGTRTMETVLDLTLDGVQGPRGVARRWRTAVDGTITGRLQATIVRTPRGGDTTTVEIDETFGISFPTDGTRRVAEIVLAGRRYRADVETGDIASVSD